MKKSIKLSLKLVLSVLMLLSLLACSNNETSSNDETNNEKTPTVVEARTAIIFDLKEGNKANVYRNSENNDAYVGMRLLAGDIVETDATSTVYLRVDDDKNILLNADSKLGINEISKGKLSLEVLQGSIFFDVENKLSANEEMTFSAGGTTMSIRGTSGFINLLKKQFSILEGKGEVKVNDLVININNGNVLSLANDIIVYPITIEELEETFVEYLESNKDYQEKLEEAGWKFDENGEVEEIKTDETAPSEYGFKQDKEGVWSLKDEKLENNEESEPYKEEKEEVISKVIITNKTEEKVEEKQEEKQESTNTPVVTPPTQPTICEHCGKEITAGDTTHTTKLSSTEAQTQISSVNTILDGHYDALSSDHYLCELGTLSGLANDTLWAYCYLDSYPISYRLSQINDNTKVFVESDGNSGFNSALVHTAILKDTGCTLNDANLATKLLDYVDYSDKKLNSQVVSAKLNTITNTQKYVTLNSGKYSSCLSGEFTFGNTGVTFDELAAGTKDLDSYCILNSQYVINKLADQGGIVTTSTSSANLSNKHIYGEIRTAVEVDNLTGNDFSKLIIKYMIFSGSYFYSHKSYLDQATYNVVTDSEYTHGLCDEHCIADLNNVTKNETDKHMKYFCNWKNCKNCVKDQYSSAYHCVDACKYGRNKITYQSEDYYICDSCYAEYQVWLQQQSQQSGFDK